MMPRCNGTGPMGLGSGRGRGMGTCVSGNSGVGRCAFGGGFGCGAAQGNADNLAPDIQRERLQERKRMMQNRLAVIDKELENL